MFPAYAHYLWARVWLRVGWVGVDLFFVLSGYLISGLLFADHEKHKRIDLSRFYIRRGLKIWPAFYALLAVRLLIDVVLRHKIQPKPWLVEIFFLQSYLPGYWTHTWSLAVEEHFYIVFPLLLVALVKWSPKRFNLLPQVFAVIATLALLCRFAVGWKQDGTNAFLTWYFPTHLRIDGLMFGVLLRYYHDYRPHIFKRIASWSAGRAIVGFALVLLLIFPVENRHMHTWGFTVMYLASGFVVVQAVSFEGGSIIGAVSRLLAAVGIYSYSIYLWHIFFQELLEHLHLRSFLLWFFCYVIGAGAFGIIAAKAIEIPVLGLRERFFPEQK